MRNRWEGKDEEDLDAPTTVTGRELRSLRAKSRWGIIALILALLLTGAFAYAMVAGSEQVDTLRERLGLAAATPSATAEPAPSPVGPAASPVAHTGPADSLGMPPPAHPDSAPDTAGR